MGNDQKLARPLLEDILAGEPEDAPPVPNYLSEYVEVTTRSLAIFNLNQCAYQLESWQVQPLRLAHAAKAAHMALQAALIDALAGSASIGAYRPQTQAAYLEYFEKSRDGEASPPKDDYVMHFSDLLTRAMTVPMEWSGQTLEVPADEKIALDRLTYVRHRVEHPRPSFHFIEPFFIASTLPVAAKLTLRLLDECSHQYDDGDRIDVIASVEAIGRRCAEIVPINKSLD